MLRQSSEFVIRIGLCAVQTSHNPHNSCRLSRCALGLRARSDKRLTHARTPHRMQRTSGKGSGQRSERWRSTQSASMQLHCGARTATNSLVTAGKQKPPKPTHLDVFKGGLRGRAVGVDKIKHLLEHASCAKTEGNASSGRTPHSRARQDDKARHSEKRNGVAVLPRVRTLRRPARSATC